jgi:electron transport complex protein RnfC
MRLDGRKRRAERSPITTLPPPPYLNVPLKQHIGAPAEPVIKVGERVLKGQLLARARGAISAPIHAPTSGWVIAIGEAPASHPSGLDAATITVKSDGEHRWTRIVPPADPLTLDAAAIEEQIAAAGVVGLGGATFPAAAKLRLRTHHVIGTLLVNGAECEPYLTCDDRLMQERAEAIIDGVRIMLRVLEQHQDNRGVRALIAIERNKHSALAIMKRAASAHSSIAVQAVPTRYPMGSEKHLIKALTGKEVPARALAAEIRVLVHNVGTAYAIHRALRFGRPLISRIVTISGGAVASPQNLEVLIGTPVSALLRAAEGLREPPARLIMGGPMMGAMLPHAEVPVVKGSSGILALTATEVAQKPAMPCVRCGTCVTVCPCGLVPVEMVSRIRSGRLEGALRFGLLDCVGCGTCAYSCPSRIPLLQYLNFAKGELTARERQRHKAEQTRRLVERRKRRLAQEATARTAAKDRSGRQQMSHGGSEGAAEPQAAA